MGRNGKNLHVLWAGNRSHACLLHSWLDPLINRAGGSLVPVGACRGHGDGHAVPGGATLGTGGSRHGLDRVLLAFDGSRHLVCWQAYRFRCSTAARRGVEVHRCIVAGRFRHGHGGSPHFGPRSRARGVRSRCSDCRGFAAIDPALSCCGRNPARKL